jgi:hypothetical protein
MSRLFKYLRKRWLSVTLTTLLVAGLLATLVYKLGSLPGGLSSSEIATANQDLSFGNLLENPLFLPLKLVQLAIFSLLGTDSSLPLRLPSVFFGVLTFLAVVRIMRVWYGSRSAWYGAAIFFLSAWFLHVSRLATVDIIYLWTIPALLFIQSNYQRFNDKSWIMMLNTALLGLILFIPGALWLVLLAVFWQRYDIVDTWKNCSRIWQKSILLLIGLIPIGWLSYALIKQPSQLTTWLGAPDQLGNGLQILKNIANVPVQLFFRGPNNPELWLNQLPILNTFLAVMLIGGVYFYARHWQAPRSRLLLLFFIIATILVGLGGPVSISLIIPLCYVVAVGGIGYLVRDWLKTFPRNPLARALGIGLVVSTIVFTCLYSTRSYFVAWPYNAETRAVFSREL